jgi:glycosyltransferase involved in cell wall biosynthesis
VTFPSNSLPALSAQPEPDTTIVVPVWGRYGGNTLLEALASLAEQDLPARILVVDNASEDDLPELPAAEVIRAPERLSVGAARNLGLEHVSTPYVLFWDADDLMLAGTLRFLRDRLAANPGVVAVAAGILEDEPRVPHGWPRGWTAPLARMPAVFAVAHSVWSLFPSTGATLMRTSAARGAAGFADANSGEDWVLGVSLAFRGRVELHRRPGRIYRRRVGSLWEERRSLRHLLGHSAAVRQRVLADREVPSWAKALLPLVAVAQWAALLVVRPLVKLLRRGH